MVLTVSLAAHVLPRISAPAYHHIHRRADSSVALAQALKQNANHPAASHLLLFETQVTSASQLVLSQSHVEGVQNTVADSISRNFSSADGPTIRATLAPLLYVQPTRALWTLMEHAWATSTTPASFMELSSTTAAATANLWHGATYTN
jgi:hypothetical protein